MTTLSHDHNALSTLRMLSERPLRVLGGWLAAIDRALADALDRSRRSEHERFLSQAGDVYQLERMERQWERRQMETWRVQ